MLYGSQTGRTLPVVLLFLLPCLNRPSRLQSATAWILL